MAVPVLVHEYEFNVFWEAVSGSETQELFIQYIKNTCDATILF